MLNLYPPSAHAHFNGAPLHFPPGTDAAAQAIHDACKGLGTDEATLISVLGTKTPDQRYLIAVRFQQMFNKDLRQVLHKETSGDFQNLLELLVTSMPEAEAQILRRATKGLGTKEELIYPIVMGRTNVELNILKRTYFDLYNEDLNVVLNGDLGGDFKKVILASMQAPLVDFDPSIHTPQRAEADAEALYKAGVGRLGTDEHSFINVLVTSPPQHLRAVAAAYQHKHKDDLIKAVKKEFSGDAEKALVFLLRLVLQPLELIAELFEDTMKGFGTREDALSSTLVRYHIILSQIRPVYKQKFGKELRDRIHGETGGDYRKLLMAVFDAPAQ